MTDAALSAALSPTRTLLPFAAIVFLGYSALGIPLSTLPVEVHVTLGYGTTIVGVVIGLSAVTTLLSRKIAGGLADRRGPKFGVLAGLCITAMSGVAYLVALALPQLGALGLLAAGRVLVGLGDAIFTTALMAWAVTRVGPHHAGRAMAWIGIAMYGALAVGAPLGSVLGASFGFAAVAIATSCLPLLALPIAAILPGLPGTVRRAAGFLGILRIIWAQGLAVVLASSGFGTIAAFLALRYAALGWSGAGLALTAFGVGYIAVRLLLGHLPDRIGGRRVALGCLAVEAAGLLCVAFAASPAMAMLGTLLTGLGYSLVFPSMGVEAVRRVKPEDRGVALGAFLACFDLGLGAAGPVTGLVASGFGLPAAFIAASMAALLSMAIVLGTKRA